MTTPAPSYGPEQLAMIERLERDLERQLAGKPNRLAHSLSVASTAEELAVTYGVDPYLARVAGILHDWSKALPKGEVVRRSVDLGIDLGVDPWLVQPLLHGIIASKELPSIYPELPPEVFRAISLHTTGAADMEPLDMVLFVADGIEPLRPASAGIEKVRSLVGSVSLEELYWESFVGGMVYVIEGGRYLYPGTIEVYNALALRRRGGAEVAGKN